MPIFRALESACINLSSGEVLVLIWHRQNNRSQEDYDCSLKMDSKHLKTKSFIRSCFVLHERVAGTAISLTNVSFSNCHTPGSKHFSDSCHCQSLFRAISTKRDTALSWPQVRFVPRETTRRPLPTCRICFQIIITSILELFSPSTGKS